MRRYPRTLERKIVPLGKPGGVPRSRNDELLSWEDAFKQMAREKEDWSDLDATLADGLAPDEMFGE